MKSKPNEIELKGLKDWILTEEVVYASSYRERKRLIASLFGSLKVTVAGVTVWKGIQPFDAVEAYNAITEKYVEPKIDFTL